MTPVTPIAPMTDRLFERLAVVGAGNMGSGIAQKMATEGFAVVLVDLDDEKVARGLSIIDKTLEEGVSARSSSRTTSPRSARGSAGHPGSPSWPTPISSSKRCSRTSRSRRRLSRARRGLPPGRDARHQHVVVLGHRAGRRDHAPRARARPALLLPPREEPPRRGHRRERHRSGGLSPRLALQEALGKTPIASSDAPGFIVNRYFVPWLNEAVRMLEEGVADIPTIEAARQEGLRRRHGAVRADERHRRADRAPRRDDARAGRSGRCTPRRRSCAPRSTPASRGPSTARPTRRRSTPSAIALRPRACFVAGALVDEGVGTIEDTDIGARVGLRWRRGPFELMNRLGIERARATCVARACRAVGPAGARARSQSRRAPARPFRFELVRSEVADGIATLTINRPDAMNALDEAVVAQLDGASTPRPPTGRRGIVSRAAARRSSPAPTSASSSSNIEAATSSASCAFTQAGQELLRAIETLPPSRSSRALHGLALGGGVELALACDSIVATPQATSRFPETGIGIYPGLGGTQRTPRRIGAGLAQVAGLHRPDARRRRGAGDRPRRRGRAHEQLDDAIAAAIAEGCPARESGRVPGSTKIAGRFFAERRRRAAPGKAADGGDSGLAKAMKRVGARRHRACGSRRS